VIHRLNQKREKQFDLRKNLPMKLKQTSKKLLNRKPKDQIESVEKESEEEGHRERN